METDCKKASMSLWFVFCLKCWFFGEMYWCVCRFRVILHPIHLFGQYEYGEMGD